MPKPGAAHGCAEGPHVPMPNIHGAAGQRHDCSQGNNLVSGFAVPNCRSIIHVVVGWLSQCSLEYVATLATNCPVHLLEMIPLKIHPIKDAGTMLDGSVWHPARPRRGPQALAELVMVMGKPYEWI